MAMVAAAAGPETHDAERDLEAAIYREVVRGDLRGAMEQYRAILARSDKPRAVAAQAMFHIGECLEKTGQAVEAYNTYRRLQAEFGDQADLAAQAKLKVEKAAQLGPRNLKFDEGVVGKLPPGWFAPEFGNGDDVPELQREGCHSRFGCALVNPPWTVPKANGNLMQSFSAAAYRGKTVRVRAWLKLQSTYLTRGVLYISNNPGDDSAQLWLKVERANRQSGFTENGDEQPVRSSEWSMREIVARIDDDAQFIRFGVMSIGRSRAWVDDVSFEVVPQ
jgi:hypothetical protein